MPVQLLPVQYFVYPSVFFGWRDMSPAYKARLRSVHDDMWKMEEQIIRSRDKAAEDGDRVKENHMRSLSSPPCLTCRYAAMCADHELSCKLFARWAGYSNKRASQDEIDAVRPTRKVYLDMQRDYGDA